MAISADDLAGLEPALLWGAVALALFLAAFLPLRVLGRGARLSRLARRNGWRFTPSRNSLSPEWNDLACFHRGAPARIVNCIEGERCGRPFAAFDYHYELPGFGAEARAYMGPALTGWLYWYLLPLVDHTRDPGFTAVVVKCRIPPGTRTVHAKRGFAPWRVEFGEYASVVHCDDGYRSPDEIVAAVERLDAALDLILSHPSPSAT